MSKKIVFQVSEIALFLLDYFFVFVPHVKMY